MRRVWEVLRGRNVHKGVFFTGWIATFLGGVASLLYPTMTIGVPLGAPLSAAWSCLWIFGGSLAAISVWPGWWRSERLGIGFIGVGLAVYFGVVVLLHFGGTGSRVSQMTMLILAGVALLSRYLSISSHDYEPRRGE